MTTQTEQSDETNVELKKRAGLIASFSYAIDGVLRTLCSQRNMKVHWVSGLAVMLVGMALELDLASRASVIFCVFVVICMEVLNTAFEAFVDLHVKNFARHAMVAKDAAAAAVLVLAVCAVVVFADVLFHRWAMVEASGPAIQRTVLWGVPLLVMVGLILGMSRRVGAILALGFAAVSALTVLAWFSRDEIFSLGALGFVVSAVIARLREPALEA